MNNYLIADYILGYSLSNDSFFSATDISLELSMPSDGLAKIFVELCRLNEAWFEIIPASSQSEMKLARRKEYDDEIIEWLINGESKNHFKKAELIDSIYYSVKPKPGRSTKWPLKSILRVITYISTREMEKDREWVLKNVVLLKKAIRKGKRR